MRFVEVVDGYYVDTYYGTCQAYEFIERRWMPGYLFTMYWIYPYPYLNGASFLETLQNLIKNLDLPPETIIYYSLVNETFGAVRPVAEPF